MEIKNNRRAPMPVSERAKQFMPFKAVAGLDEALERKRLEIGQPEKGDAAYGQITKTSTEENID